MFFIPYFCIDLNETNEKVKAVVSFYKEYAEKNGIELKEGEEYYSIVNHTAYRNYGCDYRVLDCALSWNLSHPNDCIKIEYPCKEQSFRYEGKIYKVTFTPEYLIVNNNCLPFKYIGNDYVCKVSKTAIQIDSIKSFINHIIIDNYMYFIKEVLECVIKYGKEYKE